MTRILIVFLLFLVLIFNGCEWLETIETTYPDYEAAMKAGAVGEGKWIPEFLPQSATDIKEKHDLDTNKIWLFFHFDSPDLPDMVSSCEQAARPEVVYPRKRAGNWWPRVLTERSGDTQRKEAAYMYYRCENTGVMAVNIGKNEVYYWDLRV